MSTPAPIWMQNTSWRDSGRMVKVGPFDGRLMIFFIVFLLFPSFFLFYLIIAAVLFFYGLEYVGYTLPNAWRKIFVFLAGKKKSGVHYWRQKKL